MTANPTAPAPSPSTGKADQSHVPIWRPDARADSLSDAERDYLFDVRGFDVIQGALSSEQLQEINRWIDQHDIDSLTTGQWFGHVETHKYDKNTKDGINFQNIIEGGAVFEKLIDSPAWIDRVRRYIEIDAHVTTIDENFLNIRQSGGFIPIHSGGAQVRYTATFRNHVGQWMVGQINILMALTDIGLGDGCTTVVPGSHKAHERHPSNKDGGAWGRGVSGDAAAGMVQVHLKAGDALFFTDAITHGSLPRINPGYRRVMIYRYVPHMISKRYNYIPSDELLSRLSPRQRQMVMSQPPRLAPGRSIVGVADDGPKDVGPVRD